MPSKKTTGAFISWWKKRAVDWPKDYGSREAMMHPHRKVILEELSKLKFRSLCEVGCGAGANLALIRSVWPKVQVGGADVVPGAIDAANKLVPGAIFDVRPAHDLFFSDKSCDVVLTDACLIYVDPLMIKKTLLELRRVARGHIVLCEFHHKNFLARLGLWLASGYFSYNYRKLLESLDFYDIKVRKLTPTDWSCPDWRVYGNVITASIPIHG